MKPAERRRDLAMRLAIATRRKMPLHNPDVTAHRRRRQALDAQDAVAAALDECANVDPALLIKLQGLQPVRSALRPKRGN